MCSDMRRLLFIGLARAFAGCKCARQGPETYGQVRVDQDTVDFGRVLMGKTSAEGVIVRNAGPGLITVTGVDVQSGIAEPVFALGPLPRALAPGEEATLTATFSP